MKSRRQSLVATAANPDYQSYHTNEEFLTREQLAEVFKTMGSVIPDLHWEIVDIQTLAIRSSYAARPLARR